MIRRQWGKVYNKWCFRKERTKSRKVSNPRWNNCIWICRWEKRTARNETIELCTISKKTYTTTFCSPFNILYFTLVLCILLEWSRNGTHFTMLLVLSTAHVFFLKCFLVYSYTGGQQRSSVSILNQLKNQDLNQACWQRGGTPLKTILEYSFETARLYPCSNLHLNLATDDSSEPKPK